MGIALIVLAILQIGFLLIKPRCYVFSRERLVIKYFFGIEENIPWQDIRAIISNLEDPGGLFPILHSYRFIYYSEEKQKFFMQGDVSKNRKIKKLMQKYCPKKYNW